jgi:hypothetical protein
MRALRRYPAYQGRCVIALRRRGLRSTRDNPTINSSVCTVSTFLVFWIGRAALHTLKGLLRFSHLRSERWRSARDTFTYYECHYNSIPTKQVFFHVFHQKMKHSIA